MIRKERMPGVCAAILIGIAAYSNLTTMDVQAADTEGKDIPVEGEGDGKENTTSENESKSEDGETHAEYLDSVDSVAKEDLPDENVNISVSNSSTTDDAGTKTETTETKYTWTDENGEEHTKTVTTTDTDAPDSYTSNTVDNGYTNTNEYGDEEKLDHVEADGTRVYITSETESKTPTVETTIDTNESSVTTIVETVTETVPVYDKDGNLVTHVVTDDSGNPVQVTLYDKNGAEVGYLLADENGDPIIPDTYYDALGNPITDTSLLNITYERATTVNDAGETVFLFMDPDTGEIVYQVTKTVTTGEKVECDESEATSSESVPTGTTHFEDCSATDEGAQLKESSDTSSDSTEETVTVTMYDSDETLRQIKELLGDFGITVQEIQLREAQTNVNAGTVTSSNQQTGVQGNVIYNPEGTGDNAGFTMIIEKLDEGVTFTFKNTVKEVKISSSEYLSQLIFNEGTSSATVDTNYTGSVEQLRSEIEALANQLYDKEDDLDAVKDLTETSPYSQKYQLDFTTLESDVTDNYNVTSTQTGLSSDKTIETSADDTFNVVYATITLGAVNKVDLYDSSLQWNWNFHMAVLDATGVDTYNMSSSTQEQLDKYAEYIISNNLGTYKETYTTTLGTKFTENDKLTISMNSDQIVVINVDTSSLSEEDASKTEIDLWKFLVNYTKYTPDTDADGNYTYDEDGKLNVTKQVYTYNNGHADGERVSQQIIFNFGSFSGVIKSAGQLMGTYIAPNATWINSTTSNGQLVCNKYIDNFGEWHYTGNYSTTKTVASSSEPQYEREVADMKTVYYKDATKEVENTPLYTVNAIQLEGETTKVPKVVSSETLNWKAAATKITTGGKEDTQKTYNYVYPEIEEETPDEEVIHNPEPEDNSGDEEQDEPETPVPTITTTDETKTFEQDGETEDVTLVTIEDEEVATSATPNYITIDGEEVALAAAPKTGDTDSPFMYMMTAFGSALVALYSALKLKSDK